MKSMILWPEQKLLHWLARNVYTGEGCIGDLGCFVGSSTLSLASGLSRNPHAVKRKVIHSYDMFVVPDDPYTLKRLPGGRRPGDRFIDVFLENIGELREWIEVHDGDLRREKWKFGPIEILFIDICKCWSTNQAVMETFFPHLIAGRSIIVHQDFVRVWNPWIPVTMAYLAEYFEVLAEEESSRIYRLVKPIPEEVLQKDLKSGLTLARKRDLLEASIASSPATTAAVHKGALAMLLFMEGETAEARDVLAMAIKAHAEEAETAALYRTLSQTMDYWKTGDAYERQMEDKF